jgi:succinoglycan biosynthesis transport protein ExoP
MNGGEEDRNWDGGPGERGYLTTASPQPLVVRGNRQLATSGHGRFDSVEEAGPEINLLAYWHIIMKHRLVVGGIVLAMIVLGVIVTLVTTPVYRATATIQIDREGTKVIDIQDTAPVEKVDQEFFQTQYALIMSRSLAERVVRRENLASDPRFMSQKSTSALAGLGRLFSRETPQTGIAGTPEQRARQATAKLSKGLSIEPVRGSRLVKLRYESPDRGVAQRVVNAVAENYIGSNLDRRFEGAGYARSFLEEKLATVKAQLEKSEKELVAYAQSQGIVNVTPTTTAGGAAETASSSLTASDLVAMNSALAVARGQRIAAEQKWNQARLSGMALPEILASPTIQSLRGQQNTLRAQYQEKLAVYKPDFPAMVQLKAQIDTIDAQIAAEATTIRQSVQAQYQTALRQEQQLAGQVSSLKGGVMDLRNRSIQYNILQREVDTNRSLYEGLLQRYKDIGVAGGVGNSNISIVDRADEPRSPYKPKLLINLGLAAAVGLLLGLVAAFGLESLDETIKLPEDVEGKLGLPLMGAIPMLDKGVTIDEAMADARSALSEAYYSVRTALQFSTNDGVPRSLLVASARPSEGKSTTATALAHNFAKLGMRVLLVDGDLRNPSLHRLLRADSASGITNYLTGSATLAELVQATDQPNLSFIPCGPLPPNPAELLAGSKIRSMIADAERAFDLLVIDGPPVMGLADAPLLASAVAGTVLVIEAGQTRQGLAKAALRRLALGNARILGGILTKFNVRNAGYGYGHGYGYAYAYSYDYGGKALTDQQASRGGRPKASAG